LDVNDFAARLRDEAARSAAGDSEGIDELHRDLFAVAASFYFWLADQGQIHGERAAAIATDLTALSMTWGRVAGAA
jgi:hypothetical protein